MTILQTEGPQLKFCANMKINNPVALFATYEIITQLDYLFVLINDRIQITLHSVVGALTWSSRRQPKICALN